MTTNPIPTPLPPPPPHTHTLVGVGILGSSDCRSGKDFVDSTPFVFLPGEQVLIIFVIVIAQGLGYSIVVVNTLLSIYYNVIMAWGFVYLFNSFRSEVPWKTCGNSWNSLYCKYVCFVLKMCPYYFLEYIFSE